VETVGEPVGLGVGVDVGATRFNLQPGRERRPRPRMKTKVRGEAIRQRDILISPNEQRKSSHPFVKVIPIHGHTFSLPPYNKKSIEVIAEI
jgi:hypothetical protein